MAWQDEPQAIRDMFEYHYGGDAEGQWDAENAANQAQADPFSNGEAPPQSQSQDNPNGPQDNPNPMSAPTPTYDGGGDSGGGGQQGYGPYATPQAPQVTWNSDYTEGNRQMQSGVDQFGNPYWQQVGTVQQPAAPVPGGGIQPGATSTQKTVTQGQVVNGDQWVQQPDGKWVNKVTGQPAPTAGAAAAGRKVALTTPDGATVQVDEADVERVTQELRRVAEERARQRKFEEDMRTRDADRADQQLKISEMLAEYDRAYKQALIEGANADRAAKIADAAMQNNYQMQLLMIQEMSQRRTLAVERRKADEERRARRPLVRRAKVSIA